MKIWQAPAPTYVVFLGDANQDYKDNLQTGTPNYVPSQNIESNLFGDECIELRARNVRDGERGTAQDPHRLHAREDAGDQLNCDAPSASS